MTTLALENLFNRVTASFAADEIQASNTFGWRAPAEHPYGNRIAWVPGDPSDSVGTMGPVMFTGAAYPRPLGTLSEYFTLYISATDPSDPENELKQYHIVRMLRDAWFRAAYKVAHGTFSIRSETWLSDRQVRRAGATLKVVCEIQSPVVDELPDEPLVGNEVPSDTVDARAEALAEDPPSTLGAELTTELEDTPAENISMPPGPPSEP